MWQLFNDVNALKSLVGENLNQFFCKAVDKKVSLGSTTDRSWRLTRQMFFDYYDIIKKPMTMNQIKKKIGKEPGYNLAAFRADMHLVWDNARTYNGEDSWVYGAADDMQEFFDKQWDELVPKFEARGSGAGGVGSTASASAAASGTSTPMFKPDKITLPTKIRINMGGANGAGAKKRLAEVSPDPTQSEEASSDDGDDDDY